MYIYIYRENNAVIEQWRQSRRFVEYSQSYREEQTDKCCVLTSSGEETFDSLRQQRYGEDNSKGKAYHCAVDGIVTIIVRFSLMSPQRLLPRRVTTPGKLRGKAALEL